MPLDTDTRTLAAALSHALRVPGTAPFLLHRRTLPPTSPAGGGAAAQTTTSQSSTTDDVVSANTFNTVPYTAVSYEQVADAAAEIAAGLRSVGATRGSCVGIASENRAEWLETDFACAFGDFMNVGLHLGWPTDKLAHIIDSAECSVIVVSLSGAAAIAAALAHRSCSTDPSSIRVSPIIVLMPVAAHESKNLEQEAISLLPDARRWTDLRQLGRAPGARTHSGYGFADDVSSSDCKRAPLVTNNSLVDCCLQRAKIDGEQPFTLMYSSGSSGGPPKATVNTKRDWLKSNCSPGAFANFDDVKERRGVSYLSLCHGADRGICWQAAFSGGTVGFARGEADLEGCLADLTELRPTFFLGFAPFWTALYQRHMSKLLPKVDKVLVHNLHEAFGGHRAVEQYQECATSHPVLWQSLRDAFLATRQGGALLRQVLNETRTAIGGCLRSAATGGSRTPAAVRLFIFFLLEEGSNGVTDSYGSTEFPGIASNGEIAPDVELKLIPCQGGYTPDDRPNPRGEILVRRRDGSRTSYWKNPELTASVWDEEGWYHTGDVGELSYTLEVVPNRFAPIPRAAGHSWTAGTGWLEVIDRVKQLEELYWDHDSLFVATQELETLYSTIPGFEHVVLTTDRNEEGFIAIVLLAATASLPTAVGTSVDVSVQCREQIRLHCLRKLQAKGRAAHRAPHEIPVGVLVVSPSNANPRPWTKENGLLTITGKVNRLKVKETYHLEWMAQYSNTGTDAAAMASAETADFDRSGRPLNRLSSQPAPDPAIDVESMPQEAQDIHELIKKLRSRAEEEAGPTPNNNEPMLMQRATRVADCRIRRRALGPSPELAAAAEKLDPPEPANGAMNVFIKTVNGSSSSLDIEPGDTINILKLRIQRRFGFPADMQTLIWNGKQLVDDDSGTIENEMTVKGLGIRPKSTISLVLQSRGVEICEEKLADMTLRGRDWLEDRVSDDGRFKELRFQFELCAKPHPLGASGVEWEEIGPPDAVEELSNRFEAVRAIALQIRQNTKRWEEEFQAAQAVALNNLRACGGSFRDSVMVALQKARLTKSVRPVVVALLAGKRRVEQAKYALGRVPLPEEMEIAYNALNDELLALRTLGDVLNVDTRSLPVTWRFALDWVIDDWRNVREVHECILGCGQNVYDDELGPHMDAGCDATGTTSEAPTAATGVNMGADTAVECELTGLTIDPEDTDITPATTTAGCPVRASRYHALDRGRDRMPWAHEAILEMWSMLETDSDQLEQGAERVEITNDSSCDLELNRRLLSVVDPFRASNFENNAQPEENESRLVAGDTSVVSGATQVVDDEWVVDKQGIYWLKEFVHYKSVGADPGTTRHGRNTPASLVRRACDAFAPRPALGVPDFARLPSELARGCLSRETPLDILPKAGGVPLVSRSQFLWLSYAGLGSLVVRVAAGLRKLKLPDGAYVAVSGYNDFEFVVADFAIAVAGYVCVPIHGTYSEDGAASVVSKVHCSAMCFMRDHASSKSRAQNGGKWTIQGLRDRCPCLRHLVVMDASVTEIGAQLSSDERTTISSFIQWVAPGGNSPAAGTEADDAARDVLPDPFEAVGAAFDEDSSVLTAASGAAPRVTTILFTSGSSGTPKAVAVGVNEFVNDISFPCPDSGVTVSYIPLSHGSDRYKVWSHVVHGARVGFCQFGAENWEWRENNKTDAPGLSAVDLLFEQIRRLKPTSMSCPPNIWAGLHQICRTKSVGPVVNGMDAVAELLGPRIQTMVTGGAPTPESDKTFARRLCRHIGASFSDSYGTTENGAVTEDGYQPRPRYQDVEIQLVDNGLFRHTDAPYPRGEVVVRCETLALGYQGDSAKTAEAFLEVSRDPAGQLVCSQDLFPCPQTVGRWYRTGDLGWFDQTGRLHLIGRASSPTLFGHVVDTLERQVEDLPSVRHAVLLLDGNANGDEPYHSEGSRPGVTLVVSASQDTPGLRAAVEGRLRAVLGRIAAHSSQLGVKVIVDTREEWSIENGLLTATLKKRRTVVGQQVDNGEILHAGGLDFNDTSNTSHRTGNDDGDASSSGDSPSSAVQQASVSDQLKARRAIEATLRATVEGLVLRGVVSAEDAESICPPESASIEKDLFGTEPTCIIDDEESSNSGGGVDSIEYVSPLHSASQLHFQERLKVTVAQEHTRRRRQYRQFLNQYQNVRSNETPFQTLRVVLGNPHPAHSALLCNEGGVQIQPNRTPVVAAGLTKRGGSRYRPSPNYSPTLLRSSSAAAAAMVSAEPLSPGLAVSAQSDGTDDASGAIGRLGEQSPLMRAGPLDLTPDLARLVAERWLSRGHALRIMEAQRQEIIEAQRRSMGADSPAVVSRSRAPSLSLPSTPTKKQGGGLARDVNVGGRPPSPSKVRSSWAVIVAGGEGFQYGIYNLEDVFELCVRQLGRDRVILVAAIEEILTKRRRAAETGFPVFSPTLSLEQNKRKNREKLAEFERRWAFIRANGGADYDGTACSADTVLRILQGNPRHPGDKVLPRDPELLGSVFFCFGGHGGSFRSTTRNSVALQRTRCDLCQEPHAPRPPREDTFANTARKWETWLTEDNNNTEKFSNTATHSLEDDQILCEDDQVITPFGPGRVVGRRALAAVGVPPNHRGGTEGARGMQRTVAVTRSMIHAPWPASPFPLVADTGQYTSPFLLTYGTKHSAARCIPHRFVYNVKIDKAGAERFQVEAARALAASLSTTIIEQGGGVGRATAESSSAASSLLPGGSCWKALSILYTFSVSPQGVQLPPAAVGLLEAFLDNSDHANLRQFTLAHVQDQCAARGSVTLRRDLLCLPFGPREHNHFHSSLKTREWAFGMPHASPLEIYGPVSWRHSPVTTPTHLLVWQQIFTGLHSIRNVAPRCRVLALTEACFSGGAMKFMEDERLSYWNKLESWPVFLISTAGEAQSSGSGFMTSFMRGVEQALSAMPHQRGDSSTAPRRSGVTLLALADQARDNFRSKSGFGLVHGASGPISGTSDVNFSYSRKSGVHEEDVAVWFTQHPAGK